MSTKRNGSQSLSTTSEDVLKGRQLTEQYKRATSGMQEVITFGAMMMQLRMEHPELAQRGNPNAANAKKKDQIATRGDLIGETPKLTLKQWLATYAPEVKEATARRFLGVTEAVAREYHEIVGMKVAAKIGMAELVTTPAKDLDGKLAAKQLELFEWVNGTSQRSWLDRFSSTRSMPPKPTKASARKRAENAADEVLQAVLKSETIAEFRDQLQTLRLAFGEFKTALSLEDLATWENETTALLDALRAEIKTRRAAK